MIYSSALYDSLCILHWQWCVTIATLQPWLMTSQNLRKHWYVFQKKNVNFRGIQSALNDFSYIFALGMVY